ncbi:HPr kinase/phosphorylase [Sphingobium sp. SYK-6]|nr:HPr kinase/phosphorylase [Sphingobium sp. SYK-6]
MMSEGADDVLHASSVAIGGQGLLIMGPSGSGKSDLALRLIDRGATLISDDYTQLRVQDGGLRLSAAPNIAGKMEIRHLGIVEMPYMDDVPALLAIRLDEQPPRMPETSTHILLHGIMLPLIVLRGLDASAPIKAEWAMKRTNLTGKLP